MTVSKLRASAFTPNAGTILTALVFSAVLSACATTPQQQQPQQRIPDPVRIEKPQPKPERPDPTATQPGPRDTPQTRTPTEPAPVVRSRDGLTPPHMKGRAVRRVALLLPFSASNSTLRSEAASMLQAAEMAVFDRNNPDVLLIALDTAGTKSGAKNAAQKAIDSGADVILGPLLAPNVLSAQDAARRSGTPILAFSTNQSVAGNGVYLLSFPPEAEVERITNYAASQGMSRFALLGPNNGYTRRVEPAYKRAIASQGAQYVISKTYKGNTINDMQGPASELAQAYLQGGQEYDAVLMPEGGTPLRSLGPLLPYSGINTAKVTFLGTSLWDKEDTMLEPALRGGIFAAADKDAAAGFSAAFQSTYNAKPSSLASLAYDGVSISAIVAEGDPRGRAARMTDPQGFYGVDGFVRFRADGTPQRGLAVYEVRPGRFELIDPAPKTADEITGSVR